MKKLTGKILALFLVCVMVFSFAACGNGTKNADPSASSNSPSAPSENKPTENKPTESNNSPSNENADRVLNVAVMGDSGSLIPMSMSGDGGMQNAALTYMDNLFSYALDKTTFRPNLVTGWDMVSDIQYTLHLREGVSFSNGNAFTAEDIIFSMNLVAKNPLHALAVKSVDFEKTNIIDDYTIDFWLTKYDVGHWKGIAILMVYDAESFDANDSLNPIGTGPYIVKDYVVNSHLTMIARDDYWGDPVQIKEIQFKVIAEESQRVNALTTGDVDISRVPLKDIEYVETLGKYNVVRCNSGQSACAFFNMSEDCILNTPEKRQAICYAIDAESIVDIVFSGQSSTVGWPLTEQMTDLEPDMLNMTGIYADGYNLEKAKEIIDRTGLAGKTLRIVSNGEMQYITTAEIIQASLREVGMDAEIISYDAASWMSILFDPSLFDLALWFCSSPSYSAVDSLNMYPQFIPCGWSGTAREEYLALTTKAVSTVSDEERAPLLRQILEIHEEYVPWYSFAEQIFGVAASDEIGGLEINSIGGINYEELYWN